MVLRLFRILLLSADENPVFCTNGLDKMSLLVQWPISALLLLLMLLFLLLNSNNNTSNNSNSNGRWAPITVNNSKNAHLRNLIEERLYPNRP